MELCESIKNKRDIKEIRFDDFKEDRLVNELYILWHLSEDKSRVTTTVADLRIALNNSESLYSARVTKTYSIEMYSSPKITSLRGSFPIAYCGPYGR